MRLNFVIIPALIVIAGIVTTLTVPLDARLRAMILAMDLFAAAAVGLLLWRAGPG